MDQIPSQIPLKSQKKEKEFFYTSDHKDPFWVYLENSDKNVE